MIPQNRPAASDSAIVLGLIIALGMILAVVLGGWVAEENWFLLGMTLCVAIGASMVLNLKNNWWILIPWMSALGFSTLAPGFSLSGVDAASLLSFVIIGFRRAIGDLKPAQPSLRLNWVFFALVFYTVVHAATMTLQQYYEGETQLKNVIKAYYQIVAPLLLLWLLALYAKPASLKPAVLGVLIISVPAVLTGCILVYLQSDVPILSNPYLSFDWAGPSAFGYIRWSSIGLLLLALCLSTATRSALLKAACFLIAALGLTGAILGGGRIAFASCLLGTALWLALRRNRLPLLLTTAFGVVAFLAINADPRVLRDLPKTIQRSLTPFVVSNERTEEQSATEISDRWHEDLRNESWDYWMKSPLSVTVGHGYKGWNDSIDLKTFTEGPLYENAKKMAIQMGRTERTFSSILVIFGAIGVLLYYGFIFSLIYRLRNLRRSSPNGSFAKAMCEFSLCMILICLVTAFHAGGVPSYGMVFWFFGLLAARNVTPVKISRRAAHDRETTEPAPAHAFQPGTQTASLAN